MEDPYIHNMYEHIPERSNFDDYIVKNVYAGEKLTQGISAGNNRSIVARSEVAMVEAATLNEVLISTKDVVRTAHDVTINTKALDDFARRFKKVSQNQIRTFAGSLRGDARTAARPWDQCDCHLIVDVTTDDGAELTAL